MRFQRFKNNNINKNKLGSWYLYRKQVDSGRKPDASIASTLTTVRTSANGKRRNIHSIMLAPEEENEAEVRREDQDRINRFARLNAKLYDLRQELNELKKKLELLDDASTELMMGSGEGVLLLSGESFFETSEDDAVQFCENEVETLQQKMDALKTIENEILQEQGELKALLYSRFGKSINLEEN